MGYVYIKNQPAVLKLLINKTDNTILQLLRYVFVGGVSFVFDFGVLYVLTQYFNVYYLISAAISFTIGLVINYLLSIMWVFNSRSFGNRILEFFTFALIGIIGLILNELFLWALTDLLFIYYLYSKMISTFILLFWNFFARKIILFNKSNI